MTYSANAEKPTIDSGTFIVLRPKRRQTGFTLYNLDGWQASFAYGYVHGVFVDGTRYSRQSSRDFAATTANGFFYDTEGEILYINSSVDPVNKFVVVQYDIYISDQSRVWHRDPMDSATDEVYWEGCLIDSPTWIQQTDDLLFGFFPMTSTTLNIANAFHIFEKHLYDSSWSFGGADVYHLLGDLSTSNINRVFTGFTWNIEASDSGIQVDLETIFRVFDAQYRDTDDRFFSTTDFPNIDPDAVNSNNEWAIRQVFGMVDGLEPVNIDYQEEPDVTKNRDHVVSLGQPVSSSAAVALITAEIDSAGTNSGTTTTLINADGLNLGDWVFLQHASASDFAVKIATINYTTRQITHTNIGARTITAGDLCIRECIASCTMRLRDEVDIELHPVRDFTVSDFANGTKGIILTDNFEANFPTTFIDGSSWTVYDPRQDSVYVRVYGEPVIPVYVSDASPVTTVNQRGGNLNNIGAILYKFILEAISQTFLEVDEDAIAEAISEREDLIGFTLPSTRTETVFPTYIEIIQPLLSTGLLRLQMNTISGGAVLAVSVIKPLPGAPDLSAEPAMFRDVRFRHEYADVHSKIKAKYYKTDIRPAFPFGLGDSSKENFFIVNSRDSDAARYLHGITKVKQIDTLHVWPPEALTWANRAVDILGERKGLIQIEGKNDFILAELGKTFQIDRESLPGYDFVDGSIRSRNYTLSETRKSPAKVILVLNDQKGIEDNTGDW